MSDYFVHVMFILMYIYHDMHSSFSKIQHFVSNLKKMYLTVLIKKELLFLFKFSFKCTKLYVEQKYSLCSTYSVGFLFFLSVQNNNNVCFLLLLFMSYIKHFVSS